MVLILGVLAAMAAPQFTAYRAGKAVSAQASSLASAFRMARSEAIRRGRTVTLCQSNNPMDATPACADGSGNWSSGWLIFEDFVPLGQVDTGDTIIKVEAPSVNMGKINVDGGTRYFISYQPLGMPVQGGTGVPRTFNVLPPLQMNDSDLLKTAQARQLTVNFAGRVIINKVK